MPHVEGHISIAELLGNQQASKVSFGEQGEIKAIESKPLAPLQEKTQQPLKPTKVPTLSEAKSATQGGGFFGGIGDFLGSPQGKQTLIGVARGLDPEGVGGQLANIAESQLEGQQFAALTRKLEAGEEITSADVVGLSPQAQQQAAGIISAKGASSRAERDLSLREGAAPSAVELTQARIEDITTRPDVAAEAAEKKAKAVEDVLDKKIAAGVVSDTDRNATAIEVAKIRADAISANIATREKERRKVSAADVKTLSQLIRPLGVFKDLQDLGDQRGFFNFKDATPDEVIGKLSVEELTDEKFMTLTGKTSLTVEQELELDAIRRFQGQVRVFQQQADETNEQFNSIDAFLKAQEQSITESNRQRVLNDPDMLAAALEGAQ